jgi:hydrogenase-4 component E
VPANLEAQLIAALAGLELLAAVVLVWRGPLVSPAGPLSVQGAALAGLVALAGLSEGAPELLAVAALVLVLKAVLLPRLVARHATRRPGPGGWKDPVSGRGTAAAGSTPRPGRTRPARPDPTPGLLAVAALVVMAYLVSRPITAIVPGAAGRALPVGLALVLIGFLVLVGGGRARTQLVGFLVLDNGIATVAFLGTGGVPLVVELGVSLDVLLVVLVLQVLGGRMLLAFGGSDLDLLRELRD